MMFFTPTSFLRSLSRALQLRIRCCQVVMDLKSPIDPAWRTAQRSQYRAACWLAVLALAPGAAVEIPGLVLSRWEGSSDYFTLRLLRVAVRCTAENPRAACRVSL